MITSYHQHHVMVLFVLCQLQQFGTVLDARAISDVLSKEIFAQQKEGSSRSIVKLLRLTKDADPSLDSRYEHNPFNCKQVTTSNQRRKANHVQLN